MMKNHEFIRLLAGMIWIHFSRTIFISYSFIFDVYAFYLPVGSHYILIIAYIEQIHLGVPTMQQTLQRLTTVAMETLGLMRVEDPVLSEYMNRINGYNESIKYALLLDSF